MTTNCSMRLLAAAVIAGLLASATVASAQFRLDTVHTFGLGEASTPTSVIQATDGHLFVTTTSGGAFGRGAVLEMTPTGIVIHAGNYEEYLAAQGMAA